MSHSYYRNPRGRMIKMFIMFGSLCFSAYMLPRTLDKIGGSGLQSLIQPGGGITPETQRMLEENGIDTLLAAEKKTSNSGGPVVITPSGSMTDEQYQRLLRQAKRTAPIRVVKAQEESQPSAVTDEQLTQSDDAAIQRLLELVEKEKKGG